MNVRRTLPVLLALAALVPARAADTDSQRIPSLFPYDADTVETLWFEGTVGYSSWPDTPAVPGSNDLALTGVAAFSLLPQLEIGGSASYVSREYDDDRFGSPSGLSDALAWGKYRLFKDKDTVFSVGASVLLPTGDEDDGLGSGKVSPGIFASAGTRTVGGAFIEAYVGLRDNGDLTTDYVQREGESSIAIGIGASMTAASGLDAFAALALETERYDGGDSFAQLAGGVRWQLSGAWKVQAQAGVGLADAAPDLFLAIGVVYNP